MTPRSIAAVLFLVAAVLYLGVSRPRQKEVAAASDEHRRARDERRRAQTQLHEVKRREEERRKATVLLAESGTAVSLSQVRHAVVSSLDGTPLSGARLEVRADRAPVRARVQLSAEGGFLDLVQLTAYLVRPGTGLILQRVSLSPSASGAVLNFEGVSPAGIPGGRS